MLCKDGKYRWILDQATIEVRNAYGVSFMRVFDSSGAIIETGGNRRAAQRQLYLELDHPDIFEFIEAKRQEGVLTQFNISVGITQKFLAAVKADEDFDLVFKDKVYQTVKAREIWKTCSICLEL